MGVCWKALSELDGGTKFAMCPNKCPPYGHMTIAYKVTLAPVQGIQPAAYIYSLPKLPAIPGGAQPRSPNSSLDRPGGCWKALSHGTLSYLNTYYLGHKTTSTEL